MALGHIKQMSGWDKFVRKCLVGNKYTFETLKHLLFISNEITDLATGRRDGIVILAMRETSF